MFRILTNLVVLLTICGFSLQAWAGMWGGDETCDFAPTRSVITWLNTEDFSEAAEKAEQDPEPCTAPTRADDPSSAVCFEEAGNPISTVPELLAAMQAERAVKHILETVVALNPTETADDSAVASVAQPQPVKRFARPMRAPTPECSAFDVQCGAQDPIPPVLMLDLALGVGLNASHDFVAPTYPVVLAHGEDHAHLGISAVARFLDVESPPPRA